jgi:kumamolisin
MTHSSGFTAVSGSHRDPVEGADRVGPIDPQSEVAVSLVVRRGGSQSASADLAKVAQAAPSQREHVAPEDFAARYGASAEDLDKVREFAERFGLEVTGASAARRTVELRGSAEAMSKAFDVELAEYQHPELGTFRGRTGTVGVPEELGEVVQAVMGLSNQRVAEPRIQLAANGGSGGVAAPAIVKGFSPPQVAEIYQFPTGTGKGQCIGVIELGGGYAEGDLRQYFTELDLAEPRIVSIGVDGAGNAPGVEADGEVVLDIDIVASIAHEASIAVYFAPNTTRGFLDAITTAVHDTANRPSVITISWGSAEASWTAQAMDAMDSAFADAALLGVTICVASGDHGAGDSVGDGNAHADFPASSPHVLGCGGTHLEASGTQRTLENVWNDGSEWASGGGVSDHFPLPAWQSGLGIASANPDGSSGRGVPDVAGDADLETGYRIHLDGKDQVIGGTSAVAPLWASLIAILNERLGHRVGFLNPTLYTPPHAVTAFYDITEGTNKLPDAPGYNAGAGWDACTGWGTPIGTKLLEVLEAAGRSAAGES